MSSASVGRVATKVDALASHHIPALREIAAVQAVMNRRLLALNDYYATMEPPTQEESNQMAVEFAYHLDALELMGAPTDDLGKVRGPVMAFSRAEQEFGLEMQRGRSRDWDRLREHLAEGTVQANRAKRSDVTGGHCRQHSRSADCPGACSHGGGSGVPVYQAGPRR